MQYDDEEETWEIPCDELHAFLECTLPPGQPSPTGEKRRRLFELVTFETGSGMVWATDGVRALIFEPHGADAPKSSFSIPTDILRVASRAPAVRVDPRERVVTLLGAGSVTTLCDAVFSPEVVTVPLIREMLRDIHAAAEACDVPLQERHPAINPKLLLPLRHLDLNFTVRLGPGPHDTIELVSGADMPKDRWTFIFMPIRREQP